MPDPNVLLIEGCDFQTFPAGGQLATARSLMKLFGARLALVGITRDGEPAGRWLRKQIQGGSYWFFPVCRRQWSAKKPWIPARLAFYAALRRYKSRILALGCKAAFLQSPEALLAVSDWNWESLCFRFAGVENPLNVSRYRIARPLRGWFDRRFFAALERAGVILATADEAAIRQLVLRSNGRLVREQIHALPTCVDTAEFRPVPLREARAALGLPLDRRVFVNAGRIGRLKGWELLVAAFQEFLRKDRHALLIFAGDGEDRTSLEKRVRQSGLASQIQITGFQTPRQVALYLNAADVVLFGSFVEGWSVSMLEALACGKPVVSTEVSGAAALILPGQNGFLVNSRHPARFAEAIENALQLRDAGRVSTSIAAEFDLSRLGQRLARLWSPLVQSECGIGASAGAAA